MGDKIHNTMHHATHHNSPGRCLLAPKHGGALPLQVVEEEEVGLVGVGPVVVVVEVVVWGWWWWWGHGGVVGGWDLIPSKLPSQLLTG